MAEGGGQDAMRRPWGGEPGRVRRRRIFYVAGYDPASPKKYHRLWTEHAPRQGALTGARYDIGELQPRDGISSAWSIVAEHPDGSRVEVDYVFLHWFDLIRATWPRDGLGLLVGAARALGEYHRSGLMARARAEAPVVALTARMPVLVGGAFVGLMVLLVSLTALVGAWLVVRGGGNWMLGPVPALILLLFAPLLWRLFESRLPVGWVARGMMAVTAAARGEVPAYAERSRAFARTIALAAADPALDEVLVVAHSMGSQQACRALGRAALENPGFGRRTPVGLLTLGSLLPFYSFTAKDDLAYREEMAALVGAAAIPWIELNSPGDAGGSAAMHPLAGLDLGEPDGRPLRLSPRFHTILAPSRYRALKRRPLELHFQYLRSSDTADGYDFFRLTAGPEPLAERAGRLRDRTQGAAS